MSAQKFKGCNQIHYTILMAIQKIESYTEGSNPPRVIGVLGGYKIIFFLFSKKNVEWANF